MDQAISQNLIVSINSLQALVGLFVIVGSIGAAFGSLKRPVSYIQKTLGEDIKPDPLE